MVVVVASPATAGVPASNVAVLVVLVGVLFLLLLLGGVGEVDLGVDGDLMAGFVVRVVVGLVAGLVAGLVGVVRRGGLRVSGGGSVVGGSRLSMLGGGGLGSRLGDAARLVIGLGRVAGLVGGLAGSAVLLALGEVAASGSGRCLSFGVLRVLGSLLLLRGILSGVLSRVLRILSGIRKVDFGVEFDVVRGAARLICLSGIVGSSGLVGVSGLTGMSGLTGVSGLAGNRLTGVSRLVGGGLVGESGLVGSRMARLRSLGRLSAVLRLRGGLVVVVDVVVIVVVVATLSPAPTPAPTPALNPTIRLDAIHLIHRSLGGCG